MEILQTETLWNPNSDDCPEKASRCAARIARYSNVNNAETKVHNHGGKIADQQQDVQR